jgi:hypothetical protein
MNENAPPTGKRAAGLSKRDGEVLPTPHALHFADFDGRIRTAVQLAERRRRIQGREPRELIRAGWRDFSLLH